MKNLLGVLLKGMGRKQMVTEMGHRREFYIMGTMIACLLLSERSSMERKLMTWKGEGQFLQRNDVLQ